MLKNGRPYHLPQISAPYTTVLQNFDNEKINYDMVEIQPSEDDNIKSAQLVVFSDEITNSKISDDNPIWLAVDDDQNIVICDGHHRYFKALQDNKPIKAIKIYLNDKDACRILNKIQDIFEYEQAQSMEEVESQDAINFYQDDENQFLKTLEEDNVTIPSENDVKNTVTLYGYRKDPIKENSVSGNFFLSDPIEGFSKYQIEFDNLFDMQGTGVSYKDGQNPVDILSKLWFPHINFEKLSKKYNCASSNVKYKAIAEKAKSLG
jgi:hypothetical protein